MRYIYINKHKKRVTMIKSNKTNKTQLNMINDIYGKKIELPTNHDELAEIVKGVLLARDHEADEAEWLKKSIRQFLRFIPHKADHEGWAYLSAIRCDLNSRKYFQLLSRSQEMRGKDAFRAITIKLNIDKAITRTDLQVKRTLLSDDYLKQLEES